MIKHKFRNLKPVCGPRIDDLSKRCRSEQSEHTAGIESAEVRAAVDAAKCMVAHHMAELKHWQEELAGLEKRRP